jgi:hypothetical protein
MATAERMEIPFVPLQMGMNFCGENATAPSGAPDPDDNSLTVDLEDLLPDPNDRIPKGVGLGLRAKFLSGCRTPIYTGPPLVAI